MGGPWEKYAQPAADGPWTKYAPVQSPAAEPPVPGSAADQFAQMGFEPKASYSDGQILQNAKTGELAFVSPGYVTQDRTTIDNMLKGISPADTAQAQMDNQAIAQHPVAARGAKFIQGVPFAGQYLDEAAGAIYGDRAKQGIRAVQGAMDRQHPVQSTALQVAGGIAGSVPLAIVAAPAVAAAAPETLGGQVAAGIAAGATAGGTEGAVSGFGAGNNGNRLESAMTGGVVGAGAGGAFGGAAPLLSKGIQAIAAHIKKTDISQIARAFNISPKAAQILKTDLDALDFPSAQRNLATAGPDAMLADAGQPTREALDAAITGGGKAARIGVDAVGERAAAAGSKLSQVMDLVLGAPQGIKAEARSISARTAPMRQAAYDRAYATPIDYAAQTGRDIEGVLSRIPSGTLKAAVSEANDAMKAAGVKNAQIMAEIAPDGAVTFREMPNVQQLDEIKKALGAVAQKEVDQFGRPTQAGLRAKKLASDLKDAIGGAVPSYGTAVKLGGDKIAEDNALDLGRKLFLPGTTRETVADTMKGASIEAKDAARQGIRGYIDDTLARVRRSIDDPTADTQETSRLLNTLSSRDARDKLVTVLGRPKAERLLAEIDATGKQFATRQAVATGSATGRREARRAAIDEALAPGIVGTAQQGKIGATAQSIVRFLTRETPQALQERRQAVLADVAKALTEKRGPEAQAALVLVQKAIAGQTIKNEEAARIGRLLGSSAALGGYQATTRTLEARKGAK